MSFPWLACTAGTGYVTRRDALLLLMREHGPKLLRLTAQGDEGKLEAVS